MSERISREVAMGIGVAMVLDGLDLNLAPAAGHGPRLLVLQCNEVLVPGIDPVGTLAHMLVPRWEPELVRHWDPVPHPHSTDARPVLHTSMQA